MMIAKSVSYLHKLLMELKNQPVYCSPQGISPKISEITQITQSNGKLFYDGKLFDAVDAKAGLQSFAHWLQMLGTIKSSLLAMT